MVGMRKIRTAKRLADVADGGAAAVVSHTGATPSVAKPGAAVSAAKSGAAVPAAEPGAAVSTAKSGAAVPATKPGADAVPATKPADAVPAAKASAAMPAANASAAVPAAKAVDAASTAKAGRAAARDESPPPGDEMLVKALGGFKLDPARSYTAQVHDVLQQAIVRGTLPPRTSLSEAAISSTIEVSRTPVREALALLADEKLVQIYRQVGTVVSPVRLSLLEQGRFVRSTLECANHVQLALTITAAQLAEFGNIVERQRAAVASGDTDTFSELDELMHRRLFEFAGRGDIWPMLEPIKRQFDRVRWLLLGRVSEHGNRALQEHEQILAKMAARDVAGVGACVAAHIDHITEHVAALRDKAPASYFEQ